MLEEIKASIGDYVSDRMRSPFYGVFVISWCLWNWKVFYITFFIDSGLLWKSMGLLKLEYIGQFYPFGWHLGTICTVLYLLILPLLSVFVIVFFLPYLTEVFYEKSLDFGNRNELIKLKKNEELLISKEKNLEITKKVAAIQQEESKAKKGSKTKEEIWNEEYSEFKEDRHFADFSEIHDAVYGRKGWADRISTDIKAYSDANGLVNIELVSGSERITLTEKGKYFMKRFTKDLPF